MLSYTLFFTHWWLHRSIMNVYIIYQNRESIHFSSRNSRSFVKVSRYPVPVLSRLLQHFLQQQTTMPLPNFDVTKRNWFQKNHFTCTFPPRKVQSLSLQCHPTATAAPRLNPLHKLNNNERNTVSSNSRRSSCPSAAEKIPSEEQQRPPLWPPLQHTARGRPPLQPPPQTNRALSGSHLPAPESSARPGPARGGALGHQTATTQLASGEGQPN